VGILNACQLEVFFPIRPLFLQGRRAITDLDPSGETVGAGPGIAHVAQVFAPGYRASAERFLVNGAKQGVLAPRPDPRSYQISHSILGPHNELSPVRLFHSI
jgi:hypothetical protein